MKYAILYIISLIILPTMVVVIFASDNKEIIAEISYENASPKFISFEYTTNGIHTPLHTHVLVDVNDAEENIRNLYIDVCTQPGQLLPATMLAKIIFNESNDLYGVHDVDHMPIPLETGAIGPFIRLCANRDLLIVEQK